MSEQSESGLAQVPKLEAVGRSDIGLRRAQNEDSIDLCERMGLFTVADGMGGHAAGEVASRAAVETLREFIAQALTDRDYTWPFGLSESLSLNENILMTGIHMANRRVCQLSNENPDYLGMGTTLATLFMRDNRAHIAHVGDSRVYRLRETELQVMTMDHSWVNEQVQRNVITEDEARNHRWRNVITRALGNRLDLSVDLQTIDLAPGDLYLLCTDGLTGMVGDEAIHEILTRHEGDLSAACDGLIEASYHGGGVDNISVVLVRLVA